MSALRVFNTRPWVIIGKHVIEIAARILRGTEFVKFRILGPKNKYHRILRNFQFFFTLLSCNYYVFLYIFMQIVSLNFTIDLS